MPGHERFPHLLLGQFGFARESVAQAIRNFVGIDVSTLRLHARADVDAEAVTGFVARIFKLGRWGRRWFFIRGKKQSGRANGEKGTQT